jgi:hypothetical protein
MRTSNMAHATLHAGLPMCIVEASHGTTACKSVQHDKCTWLLSRARSATSKVAQALTHCCKAAGQRVRLCGALQTCCRAALRTNLHPVTTIIQHFTAPYLLQGGAGAELTS